MNTKVDVCEYVATLYVDGKPAEIHRFRVPKYSEGGDWYRSLTSLNCFRRREMKWFGSAKCFDPQAKQPKFRTQINFAHDFDSPNYSLIRALAKIPPIPEFTHASLWEMYLALGYDYKKQRYNRDGKNQGTASNLQEFNSVGSNSNDGRVPEAATS